MPSKYGFETEDERQEKEIEQNRIKEQRKQILLTTATRIDPIIKEIFTDYLASVSFKQSLDYNVEISDVNIGFDSDAPEEQWWIYFWNSKQVMADPYKWGEMNPWKQQFQIRVHLQFGGYGELGLRIIGALYTLYGIEGTGSGRSQSKGYDVAELPQRDQLERQIAQQTGITVLEWRH